MRVAYDFMESLPPDIRSSVVWIACFGLPGAAMLAYAWATRGRR